MAGGSSAIYPLCKDFNKCNGLSNRRGLLACDSKAYLSTLRWNAASNNRSDFRQPEFWRGVFWLALLPAPIGITSCKPTPVLTRKMPNCILGSEEARFRAGLRPPPKLPVHISCRQLSRRLSDARKREKELNRASEQARTRRRAG